MEPDDDSPEASSRRLRRFVPVRLRPSVPNPRTRTRHRLARVAAGLAVLICLVGAWGVVRNPFGDSPVRAGRLIASGTSDGADVGERPQEVSARQRADNVPTDFRLWSVSAPTPGHVFALGSVTCGSERCPAVVTTTDGGHTWRRVHTFAHTDTSATGDGVQPVVQPPGAMSGITFVSANVGYVFGGDLWVTTDGGASFTHVAHPGSSVLDVAGRGHDVVVLSAEGCVQGSCGGRLDIARMPVGTRAPLPQPTAAVTPAGIVSSAALAGAGPDVLVLAQGVPGSPGASPGAWRLDGISFTSLDAQRACHGNAILTGTTSSGRSVVGLCDATPTSSATAYSTVSTTRATWSLLGAANLSLPTEGRLDLATTDDGTHLVASTGGPRTAPDGTNRADARTALAISDDGGRTWHAPTTPPSGVVGGFDAVVSLGGHTLWALPRAGDSYWVSTDDGSTWHEATVGGSSG